MVRWSDLRVGDRIRCPVSGLPETVGRSERRPGVRWFVRTNRHDHIRPANDEVELIPPPDEIA